LSAIAGNMTIASVAYRADVLLNPAHRNSLILDAKIEESLIGHLLRGGKAKVCETVID